jgi:hypothetical protein
MMAAEGPEGRYEEESGHGGRVTVRYAVYGAIVLFLFLMGYFLAFGPFHKGEPAYPPAGHNLDLENKAAPPPQPTPR